MEEGSKNIWNCPGWKEGSFWKCHGWKEGCSTKTLHLELPWMEESESEKFFFGTTLFGGKVMFFWGVKSHGKKEGCVFWGGEVPWKEGRL